MHMAGTSNDNRLAIAKYFLSHKPQLEIYQKIPENTFAPAVFIVSVVLGIIMVVIDKKSQVFDKFSKKLSPILLFASVKII